MAMTVAMMMVVVVVVVVRPRLHAGYLKKSGTQGASAHFIHGGIAHSHNFEIQPERNAGQGVIAIEHHMFWVQGGHGVQALVGNLGSATERQRRAFKRHAFFHIGRKQMARL
jgi:hypothetical protein